MPSSGAGPILGLDHAALVVDELDAAVAVHETLFGEACTRRGTTEELDWALFTLANTALVLVAMRGKPGALAHLASPPAGARAVLGALTFTVAEPESAARLLGRRGLPAAGPPLPWLGRLATPLAPAAARGLHLLLTEPAQVANPASAIRLDHVVIRSGDPERTLALLAGRLGLELRLDRSNPAWGMRLLFFRCGDLVVEVSHDLASGVTDAPDSAWGLTWRVPEVEATHARLKAAGLPVSALRTGRKPGTRIFTILERMAGVPTALIGA